MESKKSNVLQFGMEGVPFINNGTMFFSHNKSASAGLSTAETFSKTAKEIIIFKRKKTRSITLFTAARHMTSEFYSGEVPDRQYQCERVVTLSSVLISHVHAPYIQNNATEIVKWHKAGADSASESIRGSSFFMTQHCSSDGGWATRIGPLISEIKQLNLARV